MRLLQRFRTRIAGQKRFTTSQCASVPTGATIRLEAPDLTIGRFKFRGPREVEPRLARVQRRRDRSQHDHSAEHQDRDRDHELRGASAREHSADRGGAPDHGYGKCDHECHSGEYYGTR